jgi:hypothetical protein
MRTRRPRPLASAIAMRRPPIELVPQVCPASDTSRDDFVCARAASGVITAVRRVGLRAYVMAARRGEDLYFVVGDGSTQTPFASHVWRWDLARDAIHGLGEVGSREGEPVHFVAATSFGVLYRTTAGLVLHDGASARPIAAPEDIEYARLLVHEGVTYGAWSEDRAVEIRALALQGDRITWERLATMPGHASIDGPGLFVSSERRGTRTALHFFTVRGVTLPGATVIDASVPLSFFTASLSADGASFIASTPRSAYSVATATGVVTPLDPAAVPRPPFPIRPRAVAWIHTGQSEVWLQAGSSRGVLLAASGLTVRRRAPRQQTACRCHGEDMACGRTGPSVVGACAGRRALAAIQEESPDDETDDLERERAEPSFTGDGRFRVDRVEPDVARITRLADGAHLWARLFDDSTLLAQRDDGTYFLADRALESQLVLRLGPSLLEAQTVPLERRPELFRATLVEDFFAGR